LLFRTLQDQTRQSFKQKVNMILHKINNLASQTAEPIPCPPEPSQRPTLNSKEEFRAWCSNNKTNHCFYSAWEGVNRDLRISRSNPAKMLHGFVADYDADINDDMIKEAFASELFAPTWATKTFSGGARLIWEFEEPLLLDNHKLAERFLKTMAKELKVKELLPGFDESSLKDSQYFELGTHWERNAASNPIPTDLVGIWTLDSATEKIFGNETLVIPIEEVANEVEKLYPGRWKGKFEVGCRGPLFWVDDGIDRIGCQVGDFGMICYSSRAEASFMPWDKVLGKAFVQKWEVQAVKGFVDSMWYDGKLYWWHVDEDWVGRTKDDSLMHLRNFGVPNKTSGKEVISRAEKVLCAVQDARKIDFAAPLLFEKDEIVNLNGDKVLNIGRREAMQEADVVDVTMFPWIYDFITNIFVQPDGSNTQMDYFLAWFQRLWVSARNHHLAQGQMLVLAGDAGQGKTFMSRCIIGAALGGSVDASDILQGKTNFNKQAAETCIWRIDDAAYASNRNEAVRFGETLKRHVANPVATYHPKFRDAVEFPWKGRIVLTCNTDPQSLAILPSLNNTIADKILMLKFGGYMPTFQSNHLQEANVAKELPYFLAWLKQWQAPAYVIAGNSRFGIQGFHHQELVDASRESDSATSLKEVLQLWIEGETQVMKCDPIVEITSTELLGKLRSNIPGGADLMRQYSPSRLGRELRTLLGVYSPLKTVRIKDGISRYRFEMC
jgi:hypothetical protein